MGKVARKDLGRCLAHQMGIALGVLLIASVWPHAVRAQPTPVPMRPTPLAVPGELLVRFGPDFSACAHCIVGHGGSFKAVTGRRTLDQVRQRYGIREMEPVFGGPHAAAAHLRAQQQLRTTPGTPAASAAPDLSQTYLVRVDPTTDLNALAAQLQRDPAVVLTEPNCIYKAFESEAAEVPLPNDPFLSSSGSWGQDFPDLWGLFQIDAPTAWQTTHGEGVVVAVVDSGIDITHPDLATNIWTNSGEIPDNGLDDDGNGFVDDVHGWNFTGCVITGSGHCEPTDQGIDITDPNGHGTHVAGIIAAVGHNGIGVIGVAPRAQVMAVRGLDQNGDGNAASLAAAIVYAAENGAKVINASWGGGRSETIRLAIDYVTQVFDVVVVAAVENENRPIEGGGSSPADLPRVIGVGATMHDGARAAGSFGGPLDLLAPGGGDSEPASAQRPDRSILSTLAVDSRLGQVCSEVGGCTIAPWVVGVQYVRSGGTSMATAFVSGVAALVRSAHPPVSRLGVRQALLGGADDVDPPGWDRMSGYGRLNAARAVDLGDQPVAEISGPDNGTKVRERDIPVHIFGTTGASPSASLAEWRLTLRAEGDTGSPRELARGHAPVPNARLGTLGRALDPGRYVLELSVRDATGAEVQDAKTLVVPAQNWVAVPVPNSLPGAGFNGTIARDGSRVAVISSDLDRLPQIDVYDLKARRLSIVPNAQSPKLAPPDGRFLLYESLTLEPVEESGWALRDAQDEFTTFFPGIYSQNFPTVAADGQWFAFASDFDLDPRVGNPDRSWEVFIVDRQDGRFRQVTTGRQGSDSSEAEVQDLTITPDGRHLAFMGRTLEATDAPRLYLFDVTNEQLRPLLLHGDPAQPLLGFAPSISDDARFIAYEAGGVVVFDTITEDLKAFPTGAASFIYSAWPQLSADATKVAYISASDLDPHVTNEDLEPELFLLDVASGTYEQMTDQANYPFGAVPHMDGAANNVLLTGAGFINGTSLRPATVHLHRRRQGPNSNPRLMAPRAATIREGALSRVKLRASDADGDPLTFFAQSADPLNTPFPLALSPRLLDHGDGTADLTFEPRSNGQGTYRLLLAVFDDAGGIVEQPFTLTVADDLPEGDADCDGHLDEADRQLLIHMTFNPLLALEYPCGLADANADGEIGAADFVAIGSDLALER